METEIIDTLRAEGWAFSKVSDGIYQTEYIGKGSEFSIQLNLRNMEGSLLLGKSLFKGIVHEGLISETAWRLNEINLQISIGSFQVALETGEITYRVGFYFFNGLFNMHMIRNLLNTMTSYSDKYHSSISELVTTK